MNETALSLYRTLASDLETRDRCPITIELKNGRVLNATYDPFFKTITLGGTTFPESELSTWTKLCWGSKPVRIEKRTTPALQE